MSLVAFVGWCGLPDAAADPTSGVDASLRRSVFDHTGTVQVDSGDWLPAQELVASVATAYLAAPLALRVPGIGDGASTKVLRDAMVAELGVTLALSQRFAVGVFAGVYRARPGAGLGTRGRYRGAAGMNVASTGLLSLRPLSNLDVAAGSLDQRSGPRDVELAFKLGLWRKGRLSVAARGGLWLPFGEEEMLMGEAGVSLQGKAAATYQRGKLGLSLEAGAIVRRRTQLEAYDPANQASADALVLLDVGPEATLGAAARWALSSAISVFFDGVGYVPLPASLALGTCARYSGAACATTPSYASGVGYGDPLWRSYAGASWHVAPGTMLDVALGATLGGQRGEAWQGLCAVRWVPGEVLW